MLLLLALLLGQAVTSIDAKLVNAVLGSGRDDLWIYATDWDASDGSFEVRLFLMPVPPDAWGNAENWGGEAALVFSERPRDWNWRRLVPFELTQGTYHLSKFGDGAAFSARLGMTCEKDRTCTTTGAIIRFDGERLSVSGDALAQARVAYGLGADDDFLGMVGTRIFYSSPKQIGRIQFIDMAHGKRVCSVEIPGVPLWLRWFRNIEKVEQVFGGDSEDSVIFHVRYWLSVGVLSRDARGIRVDLRSARCS